MQYSGKQSNVQASKSCSICYCLVRSFNFKLLQECDLCAIVMVVALVVAHGVVVVVVVATVVVGADAVVAG